MASVPPPSAPLPDEQSTLSKETSTKEATEEGEMAAVGDIEAQRSQSLEIEKEKEEEGHEDPFLVQWTGPDDPLNPLNYASRRKVLTMVMIAALAFLTFVL
jgi:hypothetical protein